MDLMTTQMCGHGWVDRSSLMGVMVLFPWAEPIQNQTARALSHVAYKDKACSIQGRLEVRGGTLAEPDPPLP